MVLKINSLAEKRIPRQKFINAVSEAIVQGLTLGKTGFGNPIPAFFRALDALKGEDALEKRAYNLIFEAI